ncbi:MAG: hypothetical protein HYT87_00715 [Nitrospirae bacterium]|nr:hypothetical protein [Nitrospirota bacterium]
MQAARGKKAATGTGDRSSTAPKGILVVVEEIHAASWLFDVLPRLAWTGWSRGRRVEICYYLDMGGGPVGRWLMNVTAKSVGVKLVRLDFRLDELRDESGNSTWQSMRYRDLPEIREWLLNVPGLREVHSAPPQDEGLGRFLMKTLLAEVGLPTPKSFWRALWLVRICARQAAVEKRGWAAVLLLMRFRPFMDVVRLYARRFGVDVAEMPLTDALDRMRAALHSGRRESRKKLRAAAASWNTDPRKPARMDQGPRLAAESYGHFNLEYPERYSDVFFWQQSSLPARDLLLVFGLPSDPLDEPRLRLTQRSGMNAIALSPGARRGAAIPLFTHRPRYAPLRLLRGGATEGPAWSTREWLDEMSFTYTLLRAYWTDLFDSEDVKIYVSWFNAEPRQCAIVDALRSLGGVTVIYQRSHDLSVGLSSYSDLLFGFSSSRAKAEREVGSAFRYFFVTGYLGDHRFPLLRSQAAELREKLKTGGASRILAYFDEGSAEDGRWHALGHERMRENYSFLLEKLLEEPTLGLVLKPKIPGTLRRRLGPVAEQLAEAEATGRCFVFEEGNPHGAYPPAAAALASDIAIHGHLWSGTAGCESALAGVPTLLLDREGWKESPLYELGPGRVVFQDWESLWLACQEHWRRPKGIPGFGHWTSLLDDLDPYRDGCAAERMGTCLRWLLEGFKAGLNRESAMEQAAEKYVKQWGADKVWHMNSRSSLEGWRKQPPDLFEPVRGVAAVPEAPSAIGMMGP